MTSKFLVPKIQRDDDESCSESSCSDFKSVPGRKRKLDHLTWEEKVQRKKLKNRVAAQTSRDRKKKQMEEMQDTIDMQTKHINILERKCDQISNDRDKILAKFEKLEKEHQKLKARTSITRPVTSHNIPEEHKYTRSFEDEANVDSFVGSLSIKTEGSAESQKPLLKVKMETESTKRSTKPKNQKNDVEALLKVIMLCLLYKNSSKISNSTSSTLKSLQKVCSQMSRQMWQEVLHQAAQKMPKAQAANSACLNRWWGPTTQEWNPPKIVVA
jgi:Basic region leucine zipper